MFFPFFFLIELFFFFFNDTATTEIYTLSLHDALPISRRCCRGARLPVCSTPTNPSASLSRDRKSTRLNSSHTVISYAVFCLKKKKNTPHKPLLQPRAKHTDVHNNLPNPIAPRYP